MIGHFTDSKPDDEVRAGTAVAAGHQMIGTGHATHLVRILQSGETYFCHGAETLLQGMERLGRKGIPAGCLNGGCGVCKVAIRRGSVRKTGAMSRAYISEQEEAQGIVLACKMAPTGAVELEVVGKLQKAVTRAIPGTIVA